MTAYLAPLRGKISINRFEMLNTKYSVTAI